MRLPGDLWCHWKASDSCERVRVYTHVAYTQVYASFHNHIQSGRHSSYSFWINPKPRLKPTVAFAPAHFKLQEWRLQIPQPYIIAFIWNNPSKASTLSPGISNSGEGGRVNYITAQSQWDREPWTYEGVWIVFRVNMRAIDFDCTHTYRRTPINTRTLATSFHLHISYVIQPR